jgi:hypothetical protein
MPVKKDSDFRHLKAREKDHKRSDSGGLVSLFFHLARKRSTSRTQVRNDLFCGCA